MSASEKTTKPAAIQYAGLPGASVECCNAVLRLIQFGDRITSVRILSSSNTCSPNTHCLLLTVNAEDLIAIKSGFASGYQGTGPRTFSYILRVLDAHGADIEEYRVLQELIQRVDNSSLSVADLDELDASHPVHPSCWRDYVSDTDWGRIESGTLWRKFPPVMPFALIDGRITDLAILFWDNPDAILLKGYRRLEDIFRKRTGLNEYGAKLFSQAFDPKTGRLKWSDLDSNSGEHTGRMNLFTSGYRAYRNPRGHRESDDSTEAPLAPLAEFLLLNHLYRLERESIDVKT